MTINPWNRPAPTLLLCSHWSCLGLKKVFRQLHGHQIALRSSFPLLPLICLAIVSFSSVHCQSIGLQWLPGSSL